MSDANEENAAAAAALAAMEEALKTSQKNLQESQAKCGEIDRKYSALQCENDALIHKISQRVNVMCLVFGVLSALAVLGMMNIIPHAIMSIVISCVAALLVRIHPSIIEMNYNQESVVNMIIMSTSALVCVIATCAFAVLLPFLGACAFGGCVAYATYMFMTI